MTGNEALEREAEKMALERLRTAIMLEQYKMALRRERGSRMSIMDKIDNFFFGM